MGVVRQTILASAVHGALSSAFDFLVSAAVVGQWGRAVGLPCGQHGPVCRYRACRIRFRAEALSDHRRVDSRCPVRGASGPCRVRSGGDKSIGNRGHAAPHRERGTLSPWSTGGHVSRQDGSSHCLALRDCVLHQGTGNRAARATPGSRNHRGAGWTTLASAPPHSPAAISDPHAHRLGLSVGARAGYRRLHRHIHGGSPRGPVDGRPGTHHALGGSPLVGAVVRPHQPTGRLSAAGDHDRHVIWLPPDGRITHPGIGGDRGDPGTQAPSGNHLWESCGLR